MLYSLILPAKLSKHLEPFSASQKLVRTDISISFFKSPGSKQKHSFLGSFIVIAERLYIIDRSNKWIQQNEWSRLTHRAFSVNTRRKYVLKNDLWLTLNFSFSCLTFPYNSWSIINQYIQKIQNIYYYSSLFKL